MSQETRGQIARKGIVETIEANLPNYVPNTIQKMANLIAYDYNLSPWTVRYTYLPMFLDVGLLKRLENGLYDVNESRPPRQKGRTFRDYGPPPPPDPSKLKHEHKKDQAESETPFLDHVKGEAEADG